MNCESVNLTDLLWADETFAVPSFVSADQLHDSLRRFGILQPPWVWRKAGGKCVIVDGFKRLQWARQTGAEEVECRVFPADADVGELMLRRVENKLFGPPLNTAEKAQLVHKLSLHVPQRQMLDLCLPRLGIAARPEVPEKWRRLAVSNEHMLAAAAQGRVCERAALELAEWEDGPRRRMVSLLNELRCSASIQLELIERVREIALREDAGPQQVLDDEGVARVLSCAEMNHRQKTEALRKIFYARRYPRIRAREERFQQGLAALGLPAGVAVLPPPGFEGKDWQLRLQFASDDELRQSLAELQHLVSSMDLLSFL